MLFVIIETSLICEIKYLFSKKRYTKLTKNIWCIFQVWGHAFVEEVEDDAEQYDDNDRHNNYYNNNGS